MAGGPTSNASAAERPAPYCTQPAVGGLENDWAPRVSGFQLLRPKKLGEATEFALGKIIFIKCGAPTCWLQTDRLQLVPTRGPDAAIRTRQSFCAAPERAGQPRKRQLARVA